MLCSPSPTTDPFLQWGWDPTALGLCARITVVFHPKGPRFFELVKQALSSTERGYDLLAPKFDYTPFRTPDAILNAIQPQVGDRGSVGSALDLCCGTGAAMHMLHALCRDSVVGVDFSSGMLREARRQLTDAEGSAVIRLVRANVLSLPLWPEYDLVTCFSALGHIPARDHERFVRAVAGALRPGGRFVFVTSVLPPRRSWEYWRARAFNAGMWIRNMLWSPPFIMYYLTFLLPGVQSLLERHGFSLEVRERLFAEPHNRSRLVIATLQR